MQVPATRVPAPPSLPTRCSCFSRLLRRQPRQPLRHEKASHTCAAASGIPSFPPSEPAGDPHQVLGLAPNADGEAIQRQYNKKRRELRGNDAALQRLEEAHSSLMMQQLTKRLQGGQEVSQDIRFADRAQYLPWRPRFYKADQKTLMYSAIAQGLLFAWGVLAHVTAGTQPVIASAVVGGGFNTWKLNQVFPSNSSNDEKKQGLRNLLRGLALALTATFLGCFLFYTFPDLVATQLNKHLPYEFYEKQTALLTVGVTIANFVMSGFFR